jgi:hypothetical protein
MIRITSTIGIFIFFLLHSITGFSQESTDCLDLKKGNFYCSSPNGGFVYIERGKRKQVEKYEDEKQRFKFKIYWLDDCSYKLVLVKTKNVAKALRKQIIGTSITYFIIELKEGYHTVYFIDANGTKIETKLFDHD